MIKVTGFVDQESIYVFQDHIAAVYRPVNETKGNGAILLTTAQEIRTQETCDEILEKLECTSFGHGNISWTREETKEGEK